MKTKKVQISINEVGLGKILIDGEPLSNVRGFTLKASAGGMTSLTVELIGIDVLYEGEMDITSIQDKYVCRKMGKVC